jgi:hypothetical protein
MDAGSDAGDVSFFDADAQLWYNLTSIVQRESV